MRKATLTEVAKAAKVSPTTVSRWLNGSIQLPPATTDRIRAAIRELDYRPNAQARRLSRGRADTIGILVPDISNPFFALIAGEAERVAVEGGFDLMIWSSRNLIERELACFDRLATGFVDGLIVITNHEDDGRLAERINRHPGRVVIVDEDVAGGRAPRFFVENEAGGLAATRLLLANGHRRIFHIGGPSGVMSAIERAQGWRLALAEAGVSPLSDWHVFTDYEVEPATAAAAALFDRPDPPTAVFAGSDAIALGVLARANARSVAIPDHLSLVGFDGLPIVGLLGPALTSVEQPIAALGRLSAERLIAMIEGAEPIDDALRLPVRLVERASVAPCRGFRLPGAA
ncbi:substrate-binding domain-containing protein [Chthonobacter rhizosphaerae]|uniref:substrate-binding domain-containing protein n=1 Tax=Chthonobacter rhizosphaerae TaxID=2735553 RepID=UPI0015EE6341